MVGAERGGERRAIDWVGELEAKKEGRRKKEEGEMEARSRSICREANELRRNIVQH